MAWGRQSPIICRDTDEVVWDYWCYLGTLHWRIVRSRKVHAVGGCFCANCGTSRQVELHHISYDNLGSEDLEADLVFLCRKCHQKAHDDRVDYSGRGVVSPIVSAMSNITSRIHT